MTERVISLAGEADVQGFRREARRCLSQGVAPARVHWRVETRAELDWFDASNDRVAIARTSDADEDGAEPSNAKDREAGEAFSREATTGADAPRTASIHVPAFFVPLFKRAALHADPDRFALLYRLLWRLVHEPALRHDPLDTDRMRVDAMARAVRRDMHKMTAFVRFRPLTDDDGAPVHVAWFEPEHHIVEATAPFFARRFAQMRWAILTPECCVRWDGTALAFSAGALRSAAPKADASEQLWLTYYASIFNPARLKLAMMQKEMPRRYWKNLPEAVLIHPLATAAAHRSQAMVDLPASEPTRRRPASSKALAIAARPVVVHAPGSLPELRDAIERCRECPIGAHATQAVNGEGPQRPRLMLVGEQPGDREDLIGRPFVGPAGQLLDRALHRLGWARDRLFLTNAVRHFKFELRGQRRIHKTPAQQEAAACLHWLESEIALVQPQAAIALGATAARALLQRPVAVTKERGQWLPRDDGLAVLVTLHPSALLRMPPDEQAPAFDAWLADLATAQPVATASVQR